MNHEVMATLRCLVYMAAATAFGTGLAPEYLSSANESVDGPKWPGQELGRHWECSQGPDQFSSNPDDSCRKSKMLKPS